MRSYPSRTEKREAELYSAAEKGHLSLEKVILYPSEIRKLIKEGFSITEKKPSKISTSLFCCTVEWYKPFGEDIPHLIYSYTHNIIETYPKNHINNFAQELYVIAMKFNYNNT